jgi:integrase
MATYLKDHAATSRSRAWICHTAEPIVEWWSGKPLSMVNGANCRSYVAWRTAQRVKAFRKRPGRRLSAQTARHELKTLRAAIRFYHREYGPLTAVPAVTLAEKAPARADYFWTRAEAAARIRAARSRPETRHLVRMMLIGLYSGTRPGAILKLRWLPWREGGWIDVDAWILHRRGQGAAGIRTLQPPAKLHRKLQLHARHWRNTDLARKIASVIRWQGAPITTKVRRSWETVRKLAGHRPDSPHVLRHTAATWLTQSGLDLAEIGGYLGMSVQTLPDVYGHHHPDFQEHVAQVSPGKR